MEATTPPTFVNNLATTVILNLNFQVLVNLFFYSAAATTGVLAASKIITFVFEEIVKVLRYKWMAKYKDKRQLATEVIKILTEGSTRGWNIKQRNMEHIYFIARRLEGTNKNASRFFDQCISSWQLGASIRSTEPATPENNKFCADLQKRAQIGGDEVLKIVQKWR